MLLRSKACRGCGLAHRGSDADWCVMKKPDHVDRRRAAPGSLESKMAAELVEAKVRPGKSGVMQARAHFTLCFNSYCTLLFFQKAFFFFYVVRHHLRLYRQSLPGFNCPCFSKMFWKFLIHFVRRHYKSWVSFIFIVY